MEKFEMRDWVGSLEAVLENKLKKWVRQNRIENGETIRICWQFEQTTIQLFIFWEDGKELVTLSCVGPRVSHSYSWHGLNDKTFNKIMDRVGNLAQIIMHPPIDEF